MRAFSGVEKLPDGIFRGGGTIALPDSVVTLFFVSKVVRSERSDSVQLGVKQTAKKPRPCGEQRTGKKSRETLPGRLRDWLDV